MSEVNVEQLVLETCANPETAERLAPTLQLAVKGLAEFLEGFPELRNTYNGLALRTELAQRLKESITIAFALGSESASQEMSGGQHE